MADKIMKEKVKRRERMFQALKRHVQFLDAYEVEAHYGQVQSRLDKLEKKLEEFEAIQEEIAELDEHGEYEEETNRVSGKFEHEYYEIRAALLAKIAPSIQPIANLDTTIGRSHNTYSGVRLPQISLPDFDGDYTGWLSFKSTYESLIHESTDLNDVQRFHYLKSALKGEAAKLIESLTITSGNYAIAWETITKRYSNEYLLKKRHLQALMEYPKIERKTAASIHGLVDEFEQRLKVLKQLGEKTECWGALLLHWMCSKLDSRSLQMWEDHAASVSEPTFEVLVAFWEKRTRVLDAVSTNSVEESSHKSMSKRPRIAINATRTGERPTICPCCSGDHYMVRCAAFLNLNNKERLELINAKRLCSNCFRTGHWVRDCNSNFTCRTCGRKHHSLIHPGFPTNTVSTAIPTPSMESNPRAATNVAASGTEDEQFEAPEQEGRVI
ncbi:uncharacterized protein LOC129720336 [Wyeomyia smithii]|uniref:uncharacterized protein LOC129720336 n=1 Tax=Wyeomyia smithii TaxID=174621 RepID=UPI002467C7E6|nr:uncharacterized protein LOC129720336 [Wyeomyia smithii]